MHGYYSHLAAQVNITLSRGKCAASWTNKEVKVKLSGDTK